MLPLLVLDTSTDRSAVALALPDGSLREAPAEADRKHGRGLIPAVRDLLRGAGLRPADLKLIGIGLGPGSFTGLRIGLTAAKMLAYAEKIPLVGLDSLEAAAREAPPEFLKIAVVADAQRNELYTAEYHRAGPGEPPERVRAAAIEPVADFLARLTPDHLVIGPIAERPRIDWPAWANRAEPGRSLPRGAGLVALAKAAAVRAQFENPWTLEPIYLRRSAAEEKRGDR